MHYEENYNNLFFFFLMQDSKFVFLLVNFSSWCCYRSSIWNYVTEPLLHVRLSDSQGMDRDNKEILDDGMFQKLKNQGLSEQVNGRVQLQSVSK